MEIILLDKIDNLGDLGDKVNVKSGYARNYLIPTGKAKYATLENIAEFGMRQMDLEKVAVEALIVAQVRREQLEGMVIAISAHAGSEGKLFGSIGTQDIADALTVAGVLVERKEIRLPEGSIRSLGEHEIAIHLHVDVNTVVKLIVKAGEATH